MLTLFTPTPHVSHPSMRLCVHQCAVSRSAAVPRGVHGMFGSVHNLTSGAFVTMWRDQVDHFFT